MGRPIVCSYCTTSNGLLSFECRHCGEIIALPGNSERPKPFEPGEHFRVAPSAAWETDNIPDIWRETKPASRDIVCINAHDFLGYCLLLRAMQERFDTEDKECWFDEAIFFLRGGYEFFAHLNTTSRMSQRARIFGGLRHAGRPTERLRAWFHRMVGLAVQRDQSAVDVFVADEITSGTGVNRIMKVIEEEAEVVGAKFAQDLAVRLRFFVVSTEGRSFDSDDYAAQLTRKERRAYACGRLTVQNSFRWFHGPLLGYDAEDINGIQVASSSAEHREEYLLSKYTAALFKMICPASGATVHLSGPGTNDIPNYIGVTIEELVGMLRGSPAYEFMRDAIARAGCDECKTLFARLRDPSEPWQSREL